MSKFDEKIDKVIKRIDRIEMDIKDGLNNKGCPKRIQDLIDERDFAKEFLRRLEEAEGKELVDIITRGATGYFGTKTVVVEVTSANNQTGGRMLLEVRVPYGSNEEHALNVAKNLLRFKVYREIR